MALDPITNTTPRARSGRGRLGRLVDAVLPAPGPDTLVPVAEVSRGELRLVESGLVEAGMAPVVTQVSTPLGAERFRVLVARREEMLAREVLAA